MVNPELTQLVGERVRHFINEANRLYGKNMEMPGWSWKQSGRIAGQASLLSWKLTFNPDYFTHYHDRMLSQTVPHEVAHLVAYKIFGDRGHGRFWKMVMRHFGCDPDRCHDMSLEGVKCRKSKRTHTATCPTCGESLMITPYRVRQIESGRKIFCTRTMRCRYAKKTLVLG